MSQKVKCFLVFCVIQNGTKLKKTAEEDEDNGMISNKKPRKATLAKAKLYGCFVKVICSIGSFLLGYDPIWCGVYSLIQTSACSVKNV